MGLPRATVLIPGGGGAAAIGAIRSLRMIDYSGKIISTDPNILSAGLYLADKGYQIRPANDKNFFQNAMDIINEENIEVILPTSGFDIIPYSENKKKLENLGILPIICNRKTIESCVNKEIFYHTLKERFSLPFTTTNDTDISSFPCIVKPIFGKGSNDIYICKDIAELKIVTSTHKNMLFQEYLPGKEFSIDVLSDLNGKSLVAIPRERIEVKAGICSKGKVILDDDVQNTCLDVADYLKLIGPSVIQMKIDSHGNPKILEINPRLGGASIISSYAGINLPALAIQMAKGNKIIIPKIKKITMIRFYEDIILDENNQIMRTYQ
jgi:carbamoyl-phosphate synthase large subunit